MGIETSPGLPDAWRLQVCTGGAGKGPRFPAGGGILNKASVAIQKVPFSNPRRTDAKNLLNFIRDEHPQTIALIITHPFRPASGKTERYRPAGGDDRPHFPGDGKGSGKGAGTEAVHGLVARSSGGRCEDPSR
ncbi:MAG: hypothetical protein M0T74_13970 [Desulfitobacterium hafniense]|nr:hypothetical protein [Desulfitobacterium hafniense]